MSAPTDLLDVNVWVGLSEENHIHHARSLLYWQTERRIRLAFSSATMMGMLRVLINTAAMDGRPFSPNDAFKKYREFSKLPDVEFIRDSTGVERWLEVWSCQPFFTGKLWTDAWIAAIATENGCRVVSFDSDFAKFPGLDFLHLAP